MSPDWSKITDSTKSIAIAVSGGADSMCLLHLASVFARARGITIFPLIVNHNLRPESADEARSVESWICDMGFSAHVLHWDGPKPTNKVYAKGRAARYSLLFAACHALESCVLITGHHMDDNIETLLMRKAEGSGWRGLSGIMPCTKRRGINIIRPLLSISKNEILKYCADMRIPYINDPSNKNIKFTRARIRESVRPEDAKVLDDARGHMERRLEEESLMDSVPIDVYKEGYVRVSIHDILALNDSPIYLWSLVQKVLAREFPPTYSQLLSLWDWICKGERRELSGCIFLPHSNDLYIVRERKRVSHEIFPVLIDDGVHFLWDQRFFCSMQPTEALMQKLEIANETRSTDPLKLALSALPDGGTPGKFVF